MHKMDIYFRRSGKVDPNDYKSYSRYSTSQMADDMQSLGNIGGSFRYGEYGNKTDRRHQSPAPVRFRFDAEKTRFITNESPRAEQFKTFGRHRTSQ